MREWVFLVSLFLAIAQDPYVRQREDMVREQIAERGIADTVTLRAMQTTPRHLFVPPEYISSAYDDHPLPIGFGQTISQPYIVAYMTELAAVRRGDRVLEIGTGSGYQAAVLAGIVDTVFTIEIVPELASSAAERLKRLGYRNVVVKTGDGYAGWPEHAPFDAIVVTAGAEHIPDPLVKQLKEGGRMVIPVGPQYLVQTLMLIEKKDGRVDTRSLLPVRFVPLRRE